MGEGTKNASKWANDLRVKRQPVTKPARLCEKPGCQGAGEHRAPKSRTALNDYYWFCLEHVREYNLSWDYFRGMSPGELRHLCRDEHRPVMCDIKSLFNRQALVDAGFTVFRF